MMKKVVMLFMGRFLAMGKFVSLQSTAQEVINPVSRVIHAYNMVKFNYGY